MYTASWSSYGQPRPRKWVRRPATEIFGMRGPVNRGGHNSPHQITPSRTPRAPKKQQAHSLGTTSTPIRPGACPVSLGALCNYFYPQPYIWSFNRLQCSNKDNREHIRVNRGKGRKARRGGGRGEKKGKKKKGREKEKNNPSVPVIRPHCVPVPTEHVTPRVGHLSSQSLVCTAHCRDTVPSSRCPIT